ncbi:MAG: hypothetical protein FD143_3361 [Ignavibacteria bacterium]|nr:MAG: hypothetical protein FD143_3361 [Ignavibacteria bacterium]
MLSLLNNYKNLYCNSEMLGFINNYNILIFLLLKIQGIFNQGLINQDQCKMLSSQLYISNGRVSEVALKAARKLLASADYIELTK